jgi:choline dehydrogenase-like flavoprotein
MLKLLLKRRCRLATRKVMAVTSAIIAPAGQDPAEFGQAQFTRRAAGLPRARWDRVKAAAQQRGLTPSAVLLAEFARRLTALRIRTVLDLPGVGHNLIDHPALVWTDRIVATTVVDQSCQVHGAAGLRVMDASVMPSIPAAPTNLTCIMLVERAAAWIG